ncbi:helix-turn-helix domain-containing protein [Halomicrobium salinisoli]|uniref:helix-turn-helix domain-containing protein n=1 Tax=Halomicrobium salinisoli TaxID=2878391 RepID=UPI001CF0232D|nr:helix-turn-helix domain-containing protein [Halomicrobium salinisoli]
MLIATFSLPHDAVALEHTFRELPELEVEAERIAAHSRAWVMPCLWAANAEFDAADEVLAADPTVDRIVDGYEFGDEKYYQLDWAGDVDERIDEYVDQRGSILDAEATALGWQLRIRFVSRDQFDAFRDALTERGTGFQLRNLTEPGAPRQSFGSVTPEQRDALVIARERGYFDVPRETEVGDIAAELGISDQAVSERLRRGTANLVDATLTTTGDSVE